MATILVVDDDELDRYVAERSLKKAGYEVHLAEQWNPDELTSVDLVLMDITLKDGDFGAVNVAALREADVNVPIFLYSGAPEDDLRTLAELCRATGYIPKGDPELLVSRVHAALA